MSPARFPRPRKAHQTAGNTHARHPLIALLLLLISGELAHLLRRLEHLLALFRAGKLPLPTPTAPAPSRPRPSRARPARRPGAPRAAALPCAPAP